MIRFSTGRHFLIVLSLFTVQADANYFPVEYTWLQPNDLGSPITLSYSYNNILNGNMLDFSSGIPIPKADLRIASWLWDRNCLCQIFTITFISTVTTFRNRFIEVGVHFYKQKIK